MRSSFELDGAHCCDLHLISSARPELPQLDGQTKRRRGKTALFASGPFGAVSVSIAESGLAALVLKHTACKTRALVTVWSSKLNS